MSHACDLSIADEILNLLPESDRDRSIVYERVFCATTLDQLTKKYDISNQRIWQIEKKFLISTQNHIFYNPHSAIRIAQETPVSIKRFSILDWYSDIGAQLIGEFPSEDELFHDRCVFECFLLLLKKINSIRGYDYRRLDLQDMIADYLSNYHIYYQTSPIRANSALGEESEYIWRFIKKYGMVHLDYVASRLGARSEIAIKALQMDGYLEFYDGWFLHKNVLLDQRSIFNLSLVKMFNIAEKIIIDEVYNGLSRSLQWEEGWKVGEKPNINLLEKLLTAYGFSLKGRIIYWDKARNNPIALSRAEQALVRASKIFGPVFSITEMRSCLDKDGISVNNVSNYVAKRSPIFINITTTHNGPKAHRLIGRNLINKGNELTHVMFEEGG